MEKNQFDSLKEKIQGELQKKIDVDEALKARFIPGESEPMPRIFALSDGFINASLTKEISNGFIGGSYIPMVSIIDKDSYEVRFFALGGIIPGLSKEDIKYEDTVVKRTLDGLLNININNCTGVDPLFDNQGNSKLKEPKKSFIKIIFNKLFNTGVTK